MRNKLFLPKKQMIQFAYAKFKKILDKVISYSEFKDKRTNSVDPDEAAHYELPHLDICCSHFKD